METVYIDIRLVGRRGLFHTRLVVELRPFIFHIRQEGRRGLFHTRLVVELRPFIFHIR